MKKRTKRSTTLDDLAVMVARGFEDTADSFKGVEKRLDVLETGQEEIKLKLDNVAYRFELVELERRVEILEKRVGSSRSK